MKNSILIIGISLLTITVKAQSKAQVMLEQIADLSTSLKILKDSYKITTNGLDNMTSLKGGTLNQHQDYFNSLKKIDPAIANHPDIPVIVKEQQTIVTLFQNEINWQQQQAVLNKDELNYLRRVYTNLLDNCNKDIDELNLMTQPGIQMSDDGRMKNIDRIYKATTDKYQFTLSFLHKTHTFALDRKARKAQKDLLKKLYGIH
ncbi:MAG TPA: hypothetical protein VHA56_12565 [Mucilaginibacter sp.]|nr:hypothetical protein [Mucilaginibacter sp.]